MKQPGVDFNAPAVPEMKDSGAQEYLDSLNSHSAEKFRELNIVFNQFARRPKWIEVGATGAPAFANSWVNFGSVYSTAAFQISMDRRVFLKGLIKSGTLSTAAFALPAGYRPADQKIFAVWSNGAFGGIEIAAAGTVTPTGSNVSVSLEGISFQADG